MYVIGFKSFQTEPMTGNFFAVVRLCYYVLPFFKKLFVPNHMVESLQRQHILKAGAFSNRRLKEMAVIDQCQILCSLGKKCYGELQNIEACVEQ